MHPNELYVGKSPFKSEEEILEKRRELFGELAIKSSNPFFDEKYRNVAEQKLFEIIDICEATSD